MGIQLILILLILVLETMTIIFGRKTEYSMIQGYLGYDEMPSCLDEDMYTCVLPKQLMRKTGIHVGDVAEIVVSRGKDKGKRMVLEVCGEDESYFIKVNPSTLDAFLDGDRNKNISVYVRIAVSMYIHTLIRNFLEAIGVIFFFTWFLGFIIDYEIFGVVYSIDGVLALLGSALIDLEAFGMLVALTLFIVIMRNPYIDISSLLCEGVKEFSQRILGKPEEYIEFEGEHPILITVPHSKGPGGEDYVYDIAFKLAKRTNANLLIGRVSRCRLDLNRSESDGHPFRKRIRKIVKEKGIRLIIDLHGMRGEEARVELGSAEGKCVSENTLRIFRETIVAKGFTVDVDKKFKGAKGGTIISTFCNPPALEAIQVEMTYYIRRDPGSRRNMVDAFADAIKRFLG